MPELGITVAGVAAEPYAAVPTLAVQLAVTETTGEAVEGISLHCQIRIEATKRRYSPTEKEDLKDLFGEPERWSQTVRSLLWTHADANVAPFSGTATATLLVPCTYDFEVVATKYLGALDGGTIPLVLLFSGTIFYRDAEGRVQITQMSWNTEAAYALPVAVWRDLMELYFPSSAWLRLTRESFDDLHRYKIERGIPTWEGVVERLLRAASEPSPA